MKLKTNNDPYFIFAAMLKAQGLADFEREYKFLPDRKFRVDFAWPLIAHPLALEINGGVWMRSTSPWSGGRHNNPTSILRDWEKLNLLALNGWHTLQVTPQQAKNGNAIVLVEQYMLKWRN